MVYRLLPLRYESFVLEGENGAMDVFAQGLVMLAQGLVEAEQRLVSGAQRLDE
jgi:hypothetical protein